MGSKLPHLRLSVPDVETPDHVVEQLAAAARESGPSPAAGRRALVAVAAVIGVLLLSIGGAWATGAVHLPGLPDINVRTPQPEPSEPEHSELPPTPTADPNSSSGIHEGQTAPSDPGAEAGGESSRPRHGKSGAAPGKPKPRHHGKPSGQGGTSTAPGADPFPKPPKPPKPERPNKPDKLSEVEPSQSALEPTSSVQPPGTKSSVTAPRGPQKRNNSQYDGTRRGKHLGYPERESRGRG